MSEKLQKVLARKGLGSRREMERWIQDGRIVVNGQVASLGARISAADRVIVDGRPVELDIDTPTQVLLYHKPMGQLVTRQDPENRPIVFDHLPPCRQGRWINVGRLDFNTSGLLLFTNDGELANQLMHPRCQIEREYAVRILGVVDQPMLKRLTHGVRLEDGMARFEHIVDSGGEGANHWYHVLVTEGRNRLVRRLWESQEVTVSRLSRVRFGPLRLHKTLRPGRSELLSDKLVTQLKAMVNLPPK